jgi:hypothetical protein
MGYFSKFLGVAAAVMLLSATVVGAAEASRPTGSDRRRQGAEKSGGEHTGKRREGKGVV